MLIPGVLLLLSLAVSAEDPEQASVVVLANVNDPQSLELAYDYVSKRNLPEQNLILLDTGNDETISRNDFIQQIWNPLRSTLVKRGFVEGDIVKSLSSGTPDDLFPIQIHFRYLLICRGIPLRIADHPFTLPPGFVSVPHKFRTTRASVDSELMLISSPNRPTISWLPNPLYEIKRPSKFDRTRVISVCRLDGPRLDRLKSLIDQAIESEQSAFIPGRAYIDLHPNHPDGNRWLKQSARQLRKFGYDTDVEKGKRMWSVRDRYDAPAVYLGWYSGTASGPLFDGYPELPVGSIAAHIHSFSASTLHDVAKGWVGPLINNGAAVSFGNVYEPYLQLTLRPDRLLESLLDGNNLGDAALYAQPAVSWQNITIGDPLYRPFSKKQIQDREELEMAILNPDNNPYHAMVWINRLARINPSLAAERSLDRFIRSPSVILAHKLLTDFNEYLSPDVRTSLQDHFVHKRPESAEVLFLYLDIATSLKSAGDQDRVERLIENLKEESGNWPQSVREMFADRISGDFSNN